MKIKIRNFKIRWSFKKNVFLYNEIALKSDVVQHCLIKKSFSRCKFPEVGIALLLFSAIYVTSARAKRSQTKNY